MSFNFDLNEVEEFSGGVIPPGSYRAQIDEAELKDTNDGTGKYISVRFTVTDEAQNGRKFWEIFNIKNKSEKAVQIGLGRVKSLIVASGGEPGMFNSEEALVGLECMVKLSTKTDDYGEKNRVMGFSSLPNELPAEANEKPPF